MKIKFGISTAVSIVIANMIGTGIFTSLGFQVISIRSGFALLLLWLIGGISALIGAYAYAELGTAMPRSGGEYHFLSKIYHPVLGFMAGWVSFIIGFTAATAAAAMALGAYFTSALGIEASFLSLGLDRIIAIGVICLLVALHASNKIAGAWFQQVFTAIKVIAILVLIIIGFTTDTSQSISFSINREALREIISPAFAISLFFVSYSYSGWNAAAYIAGEIDKPGKNLPRSLIIGTLIVTVLYVVTTYVFLKVIPVDIMAGKIEIGYLFGNQIFSANTGAIMGIIFGVLLLSTVSSMIITGPRVTQVMGEDYKILKWFSKLTQREIPVRAILILGIISILYIITSTFEQVITLIGFTLNLFTMLTVTGLIINRRRNPGMSPPFKMKFYPVLPYIFILINLWILIYGLIYRPVESFAGILIAAAGGLFYLLEKRNKG